VAFCALPCCSSVPSTRCCQLQDGSQCIWHPTKQLHAATAAVTGMAKAESFAGAAYLAGGGALGGGTDLMVVAAEPARMQAQHEGWGTE
jgi:NAD(P)H-hydrate repair Nnr-like enzyme with NAD(P)H-hydrate dehydratase domain